MRDPSGLAHSESMITIHSSFRDLVSMTFDLKATEREGDLSTPYPTS